MTRSACITCGRPARPPLDDFCSPACADIARTKGTLSRLRNLLLAGALVLVGVPFLPVLLWGLPGLIGLGVLLVVAGAAAHLMCERLGRPA